MLWGAGGHASIVVMALATAHRICGGGPGLEILVAEDTGART